MKRSIITLYEDDFNKIDPTGNASKMFHQIPAQLTSNANRYLAWSATDGTRNSGLTEIISEIKDSMVVNMAYHANDPNVGMALHQNPYKYKMFAGDTGLFVTLAFGTGILPITQFIINFSVTNLVLIWDMYTKMSSHKC